MTAVLESVTEVTLPAESHVTVTLGFDPAFDVDTEPTVVVVEARGFRVTPLTEMARRNADAMARLSAVVAESVRRLTPLTGRLRDSFETRRVSPAVRAFHVRAVRAGVKLLDLRLGRDVWLPRMNLNTLDVASPRRCALAQATGLDYSEAAYVLGIASSEYYGFATLHDYSNLTEVWRDEVARLRARASDSVRITV